MQQECLSAWNKDKKKIVANFNAKVKEIYEPNEKFLFLHLLTILILRSRIESLVMFYGRLQYY